MAGYGFRLYTVKLVNQSKKSKAIDFDKCGMFGDQHVSVWVRRLLTHLEGFGPLTGPPVLHHAVDETQLPGIDTYVRAPKHGEYRTDFVSHKDAPATRIFFKLRYGRTGKVTVGVQDGGPLPLAHVPTGDEYRGILYLPATGSKGLLALEAVPSAPNPQRMLNMWLARAAVEMEAEDRAVLAGMTLQPGQKAEPHPFKLNFNQYPNVERVEKAVRNSPAAKVVLKRQTIDGAAVRTSDDIYLSSTLASESKRNKGAAMAGRMVRKITGHLGDDEDEVTIEEMEELVDGSLDGIEWTEAYIQIDDETGLKKIGLEQMDKFFVYPLRATGRASDEVFERAVASEVVDLRAKLDIELDLS